MCLGGGALAQLVNYDFIIHNYGQDPWRLILKQCHARTVGPASF